MSRSRRSRSANNCCIKCAVPEPAGPIPIEAPRRSANTRKSRPVLASRSNDSGCGKRPSSSKRASAGTGVPSWISANISLQRDRLAARRATFSIEPAVGTTMSPPRSRFARSARRAAKVWYCPPGRRTGLSHEGSHSRAQRRTSRRSPRAPPQCRAAAGSSAIPFRATTRRNSLSPDRAPSATACG